MNFNAEMNSARTKGKPKNGIRIKNRAIFSSGEILFLLLDRDVKRTGLALSRTTEIQNQFGLLLTKLKTIFIGLKVVTGRVRNMYLLNCNWHCPLSCLTNPEQFKNQLGTVKTSMDS